MSLAPLSIRSKVNLSLVGVFLLIFITSLSMVYQNETQLGHHIARTTTISTADSYFDSLNMLMLSGTMDKRKILKDKILANPDLAEARMLRGKAVADMYGPGWEGEAVRDDYDRRALSGEQIIEEIDTPQGRQLLVVTPLLAEKNHRGTNCLQCHPVKEGSVLGAVRVAYDFTRLDNSVWKSVASLALIELVLFGAGILLIGLLLRKILTSPINQLNSTIVEIERESNLQKRIDIHSKDEIGRMSSAFNTMLENFQLSLRQVQSSVRQLGGASHTINTVAQKAESGATEQQAQATSVSAAMEQMSAATQQVQQSADRTLAASSHALQESLQGTKVTHSTLDCMEALQHKMAAATQAIQQLNDQSQNVGAVLDVIKQIAEQTNLLALNASIEAARAGESGRGFAVVANEVRTLATRTHASTDDINQIISQLQKDAHAAVDVMGEAMTSAEAGVSSVQETARTLDSIEQEVQHINEMNQQVADATAEQTDMALHVQKSMSNIQSGARQTVEQATSLNQVTAELSSLAKELDQLVSHFQL